MPVQRIFEIETDQNILIVVPQGDISSLEEDEVHTELQTALNALKTTPGLMHVVVDLQLAPFFGSTMLGAMIKLWQAITAAKGKMVLCCASDFEVDVLQATKLDSVWPQYASRAEAIAALRS